MQNNAEKTKLLLIEIEKALQNIHSRFNNAWHEYNKLSHNQKRMSRQISELKQKTSYELNLLREDLEHLKNEVQSIKKDLAVITAWSRFIVKKDFVQDLKRKINNINPAIILQRNVLKDLAKP